jgi:anti-sigma B factor antagonist
MADAEAKVEYEVNDRDGVTVLAIRGRLDAVRVGTIREGVVSLTEQGNLNVVLDLAGLDWIDSSGVGLLVTLYKQTKTKGGNVVSACLQRQPQEIFRLLRLESAFKVYDTVDDAVAAAKA